MSEERQRQKKKKKSLHKKHEERRKKDCMIGIPFILAFQGDPARPFYCNDIHTYELIHNADVMGIVSVNGVREKAFSRLRRYLGHHVVHMIAKVLIYKAGISEVEDPYKKQKEEEDED